MININCPTNKVKVAKAVGLLSLLVVLTGCVIGPSSDLAESKVKSSNENTSLFESIPLNKINTEPRKLAAEGVKAFDAGRLEEASKYFNKALKLDLTNSYLQYFNGVAYHLRALQSDITLFTLAEKGYELAIQYDQNNWIARYQLGQLYLDQKKYAIAQRHLAEAAHYKFDDPDILYGLAVSSYYAQDPETAAGALARLRQLQPANPKFVRASSIVLASLNEQNESRKFLFQYQASGSSANDKLGLSSRLGQWRNYHQRQNKVLLAQSGGSSENQEENQEQSSGESSDGESSGESDENKMVIVDVVIIRSEEDLTTSKGVNLLNGLTLQFGSTSASTAAFSKSYTNVLFSDSPGVTKSITRALNIPAITYALNIANANTTRNQILARPTLVALAGQRSEFFSGLDINAAAVSAGDGDAINIEKEIGVKLAITPEFLDDGRIKLAIEAERTFLTTPNTTSIQFSLRIDTSKTVVKANVVMNYGETLILSGLSEKETENTRDGVPLLQDIPLLQYLFSKETTRKFQKSVLILLTPRRPEYVFQNEKRRKERIKKLSRSERVLTELQAQYADWFRPYPNWASIFNHLQNNNLYREFRTGDVALEAWNNLSTHKQRMKEAIKFIFF